MLRCLARVTVSRLRCARKVRFESVRFFGRDEPKSPSMKITVCGASGSIGQPLSLMLKQCPYIDELALYDLTGACGVGLELSHVDTKCKVRAYTGKEQLKESLKGARIVVFAAGVPRKPGMTRDDLFCSNAKIVQELAAACGEVCPEALISIITNPLNSTVPVVCEILKRWARFDPNRIFGCTTLDCVRANMFVAEVLGLEPECVVVPIIGGHSDSTIVPVLSQAKPSNDFKPEEISQITQAIQQAGTEVVKAKEGTGSATLSMAFAAARFTISLVKGLLGHRGVVECTFVPNECMEGVAYFASPIELGPNGVMRNLGVPNLSEYECCLLQQAIPQLQKDIKKAEDYVRSQTSNEMLVNV
ncbi:UNVERIFIED_CONTAM: hypothetical protein PYX00_010181 [Menopon gallinae]|uniref:Malate dehydrogenase, mitochondrial n=1 Tax=Menopon gallinae TaxID=328185 RepID=A0AAW2HEB3_9NEOP